MWSGKWNLCMVLNSFRRFSSERPYFTLLYSANVKEIYKQTRLHKLALLIFFSNPFSTLIICLFHLIEVNIHPQYPQFRCLSNFQLHSRYQRSKNLLCIIWTARTKLESIKKTKNTRRNNKKIVYLNNSSESSSSY